VTTRSGVEPPGPLFNPSPACVAWIVTGDVSLIVIVALFVPVAVALPVTRNLTGDTPALAVALTEKGTPTNGVVPGTVVNVTVCGTGEMTRLPLAVPVYAGSAEFTTIG
jgi:hypothetical protein